MVIGYDTRPDATVDEKLRSLIHSIQLALSEIGISEDSIITSQNLGVAGVTALINNLSNEVSSYDDAITSLDGRLDTLEDTTIPGIDGRVTVLEDQIPAAPGTDGSYVLTVTVASGTPTYTWEVQGV